MKYFVWVFARQHAALEAPVGISDHSNKWCLQPLIWVGSFMRSSLALCVVSTGLLALFGAPASATLASPELKAAAEQCFGAKKVSWEQLISACSKLVKENVRPDQKAGAYFNRGAAYVRQGDAKKAMSDFDAALKIAPQFARALEARGSLFVALSEFDKGLADLNRAIALDATSPVAFNNRALAYNGKKEHQKAIADFTKSIELKATDPVTYSGRGAIYLTIEDLPRALADFDKSLELDAKQPDALFNRGLLHAKNGDKEKARADFNAVVALVPDAKAAKAQLTLLDK